MKKLITTLAIVIGLANTAHAGSSIVYGKITRVEPVYTQVTNQQPQQVCKQVQVPVYSNNGQNNGGNALLGAIIGGVIGNQFGKGSGKEAATALGAVIGAQKGSQSGNSNNIVGYQMTNQCHTEYRNTSQSVVNEYDLTYNVNGNIIKMRVNRAVGSNSYVGKTQKFRLRYQIIN